MFQKYRIGAVLLMGGKGERFGSATPKQFHHLSGKPIYQYALHSFIESGLFDEIVLVCPKQWIDQVFAEIPVGCIRVIEGGVSRQESSYLGLSGFLNPPDYVVIHDAVRPFVSQKIILENVLKAIEVGAVNTCVPSTDTLVYAPLGSRIESVPKREDFLRGQTPQSFYYSLILKAHQTTTYKNATDDCVLVRDLQHPVAVVRGDEYNLKVTSELDLFVAEQILFRSSQKQGTVLRTSSLSGLFCIVGGSGGIGRAVTQAIRSAGGEAIVLSRQSSPLPLDLSDAASIQRVFSSLPSLDGLINCAGIFHLGPLHDLTVEQIDEILNVNLRGLILSCKSASIKEGGHIINIGSSSYTRGRKNQSVYSSSKAGVVNFTQALAEERPELHVHAIIPKRANTSMRRNNFPHEDVNELIDPEVVAEEVLKLLLSKELTGSLVEIRRR